MLVAGLAPALGASRHAVASTLRGEAPAVAGGDRLLSLRGGLVLAQVALALPLLVAAGLFLHSLRNLHGIETGFAKRNVLLGSLNPSLNGYSQERIAQFYREVLERVRALPGVGSASLAMSSALSGGWDRLGVVVEGYVPREGEDMSPNANSVTPGYFTTLGMPLVAGRDFSETDVAGRPRAALGTPQIVDKRLTYMTPEWKDAFSLLQNLQIPYILKWLSPVHPAGVKAAAPG